MSATSRDAELVWIRLAQNSVREARRLLACPSAQTVEESAPYVQTAIGCLETFEKSFRSRNGSRDAELAAEARVLRTETAQAIVLLERAATFYLGWARLLYAAACGYTARGEPATPGVVRKLSVEG
jgi:hypothetical protein